MFFTAQLFITSVFLAAGLKVRLTVPLEPALKGEGSLQQSCNFFINDMAAKRQLLFLLKLLHRLLYFLILSFEL